MNVSWCHNLVIEVWNQNLNAISLEKFQLSNCHLQQSKIVFPKHSESVAESLCSARAWLRCHDDNDTTRSMRGVWEDGRSCSLWILHGRDWRLYRNVFLSSSDLWRFSWVYAAASLIFQFRRVHDGDFVSTTKDNRDRGVFFAWSVSLQSFYIEERIGTWLHLGREASMKVMGAFTPVSIDGRFHKSYGSVPSLV